MKKIVFLCATFVGNSILGDNNGDPLSFTNDVEVVRDSATSEGFERTRGALPIIPSDDGPSQDTHMISPSPRLPVDEDNFPHRKPFPVEQHLPEDDEEEKKKEADDEETDEKYRSLATLQKAIQALQDPNLVRGIQNCSNLDQLTVFKKAACSALLAVQKRQETIA